MSVVPTNLKKSSFAPFAAAALFAAHLAIASSPAASAAPGTISKRMDQRVALPTTVGAAPSSQITSATKQLLSVRPLKRTAAQSVATRPNEQTKVVPFTASVSMPAPLASNPGVALRPSSVPALTAKSSITTPLAATISATPKVTTTSKTALANTATTTPASLASRSGSRELLATVDKSAEQKKQDDLLLAQLEADLSSTETRLNSTSQNLSAGQRQLMSFNNTLRSAIIEAGDEGAGLHPFVRVASRYAGTPYVWGGESRYGFDCSGFIIRVMRDLGYKALPHSAAEQFKYGRPIAQGLLKPGDIVFFANTYKPGISHVGIYIGKRRFIHAASTRQGTIVSSLDASPYRQKYAGARRLLTARKNA